MRKRCRSRVRSRGKVVLNAYTRMVAYYSYAQTSERWRDWTFRTISQRQAQAHVAAGEAEPVVRMLDGTLQVVGYRATQPVRRERPSPAALTPDTMMAVTNDGPLSELTPWERNEILRFRVWPLISDTKARITRPRMTETEERLALKLLSSGGRGTSGILSAA